MKTLVLITVILLTAACNGALRPAHGKYHNGFTKTQRIHTYWEKVQKEESDKQRKADTTQRTIWVAIPSNQ